MKGSVFKEEFNVPQYVQKRLLEIKNLEERQLLKEIVAQVFIGLHEHIEEEYLGLESRLFGETDKASESITVMTGLIQRERYDETDTFFSPMRASDLEEKKIEITELISSLQKKQPLFIYTIFLEADYLIVCELASSKRSFKGIVKTAYGEYKALFKVSPNQYYKRLIESLYVIFNLNYLPWQTICVPYIHKLFDVHLCSIEEWDEAQEIMEIEIDFEEYQKYIRHNCIPLWNISTLQIKSSTYPEACIDKINYEHIIYGKKLSTHADYLIGNTETHITNIRKISGDIMITCKETTPKMWLLYKVSKQKPYLPQYPIMDNQIKDNFSCYLFDKYKNSIKTKTEVARLIQALGYEEYLTFKDLELSQTSLMQSETYNMDAFIEDEVRLKGSKQQRLILMFAAIDRDHYLNRDIMSYIVTQVQKYFPEYSCEGKLV